jgi:hypothetical protein
MKSPQIVQALKPVIRCLDELGIPYYIGGSIASSIYGMARTTIDIDVIAELKLEHIEPIVKHLQSGYYVDDEMIAQAIRNGSSFNLIHTDTSMKIDVFIMGNNRFAANAMRRKRKDTFADDPSRAVFSFASPEDVIISKLQWYESGNRVSERQWLDIVGVIKVQGDALDRAYLRNWSKKLGLFPLLRKAFEEAGIQK